MAEEISYCVYIHINKYNNKKYVGITQRNPITRWNNGFGYSNNTHFYSAIKKYGWDSFEHKIVKSNLHKACACTLEKVLIAIYDTTNPSKGYNRSSGGESGSAGVVWSSERKKKNSISHKGVFINGPCSKPVLQCDLDGNIIKEWPSTMEVQRTLGFNNYNITRCANNKRNTAYKYIWKWKK